MQRTPAGLPFSIPGIDEDMLGAMQHAPHPNRHSIIEPQDNDKTERDSNKSPLAVQQLFSCTFTGVGV